MQWTHTPYTVRVMQILCIDRAWSFELTKRTCNQRRTNFACSIVSLYICLLLTKISLKNEYLYWQFLIGGYSFANCTVCISFFVGYIYILYYQSTIHYHNNTELGLFFGYLELNCATWKSWNGQLAKIPHLTSWWYVTNVTQTSI